jgi:hypothetical protein
MLSCLKYPILDYPKIQKQEWLWKC